MFTDKNLKFSKSDAKQKGFYKRPYWAVVALSPFLRILQDF